MLSPSSFRPDLVITSLDDRLIAVVEVKNQQGLSPEDAIEMRHILIDYGYPFKVPYFLLLSQDVGFLWDETAQDNPEAPPTYKFPMDKVVLRYSDEPPKERLYGADLELLVLQWLTNLTTKPTKVDEEPEKTLLHSGFNESIKDAYVSFGEAA